MKKFIAVVSAGLAAANVQAASILPTTFTTDIADVNADMTTVGGAIIGLAILALGIRWVKATFF